MHLSKKILTQLMIFILIAVTAGAVMIFNFINLPAMLFGVGEYRVTIELPEAAGIYQRGNVTYRGTEVGRIEDVRLTDDGVAATLVLRSNQKIPADLDAEVHSQSAVGEQYITLLPRNGDGPNSPTVT